MSVCKLSFPLKAGIVIWDDFLDIRNAMPTLRNCMCLEQNKAVINVQGECIWINISLFSNPF